MKRARALLLLVAACGTASAAAAEPQECEEPRADLGIEYRFVSGEFRSGESGSWIHFFTEPSVVSVALDGPSAGILQPDDVIVAVRDRLITTAGGSRAFQFAEDGGTMTLRVRRDGETLALVLRPEADCGTVGDDAPPRSATAGASPPPTNNAWLGVRLRCERCGFEDGTWHFSAPPVVTEVGAGSVAEAAGIRVGDALVKIDDLDLTTTAGAIRFSTIEVGDPVGLLLDRAGALLPVTLTAVARPQR